MINLKDLKEKVLIATDKYEGIQIEFINTDSIVIEPWTRLKCQFGCPNYKKTLTCPPYTPKAEEMVEMINSYKTAILFQISLANVGDDLGAISSLSREIEVQCSKLGFYKSFGLGAGPCRICKKCNIEECIHPDLARPAMEACGINVHKTIENNGYDILAIDKENNSYFCYGLVLLE